MMKTQYAHLFQPLRVNGMMLKNRIIAAPMGIIATHKIISSTNYGGMSAYDRSLGGCALVHICGEGDDIFEKYALDATREEWSVAKQTGARVSTEIGFFSPVLSESSDNEERLYARNSNDKFVYGPCEGTRFDGFRMKALDSKSMDMIKQKIVKECLISKQFGFDAVTLHFGHDSLCSQFLSPVWNRRTDEYGGVIQNRIRYPLEVLEAIRKAVGPSFPIILRVSRQLKVPESFSEDDMLYFLKSVENIVDMANISCGMDVYHAANVHAVPTIFEPHEYNRDFARRVKQNSKILVCLVGAIMSPEEGEQLIKDGYCDACMYGRSLIADPFWPKKAYEGREDEIVPCIRCMNCYHIATGHWNVQCSVNPRFRRENRVPLQLGKTAHPKNVVVIGGGPAGMKAALSAEEKGHHVTILEKESRLGGALYWGTMESDKADLRNYQDYLINRIRQSGIVVKCGFKATRENIAGMNPDSLIISIGAEPVVPPVKGVENALQCLNAIEQLDTLKGNIAIVGGGSVGCELALELAKRGNEVTIIEMTDQLAANGNMLYRVALMQHIDASHNIHPLLQTKCLKIGKDFLVIADGKAERTISADTIILAAGFRPKTEEAMRFYGITGDTCMVGDCLRVATVLEATNEAYFIGSNIE